MDPRKTPYTVALVAASVIGLEIVSFQALCFVNDNFTATRILAVALMGLSLGGVLAWSLPERHLPKVLCALPVTIALTLPAVGLLNVWPTLLMVVMTAPYVLASLYISSAFNHIDPRRVYFFDLVGAGLGALAAVLLVPLLREEGSFLFLAWVSSGAAVLSMPTEPERTWTRRGLVYPMAVLLIAHLAADPFNWMTWARADGPRFGKVFSYWTDKDGAPRYDLLYSRGSLVERIDIVRKKGEKDLLSVYNGRIVDAITGDRAEIGRLDNRLPTLLRSGEDPDTLLVGPSAQGLCKAVQALGHGHVDAVEINAAVAGLMTHELYERSGRAYGGMDLTIGDVRTFLARTDRAYDFITLLNTHRIWSMGHQGPPEYVHTLEAMKGYLSHLTPTGWVLFEERNINAQADLGIRRLLATLKTALREDGAEHPSNHLAIWELWHGCDRSKWFEKPIGSKCTQRSRFTFLMAKKTPITAEERAHLHEWSERLGARGAQDGEYRGIVWRHLGEEGTPHVWSKLANGRIVAKKGQDLSVVRDNRPYPFDVFTDRTEVWSTVRTVTALATALVLVPALIGFVGRRREGGGGWRVVPLTALFAVLGVGYLLIEVVLIQKLGIFLSSPPLALAIVLSSMLVGSGAGGLLLKSQGVAVAAGTTLGVGALTALYGAGALDAAVSALMFLPFVLRALAALVLVVPLAFLMGAPFPFAIATAKEHLSDRHAGLFFAINGAAGAVATPVTLLLTMVHGFTIAFYVGAGLYAVSALLLAVSAWRR